MHLVAHSEAAARACSLGRLGALLLIAALGWADPIQITLSGVGNGTGLAGVYVNPYNANVGNSPLLVICDDFLARSVIGESWRANVTQYNGDLSATRWKNQTLYDQAAYLSNLLLDSYSVSPSAAQRATQSQLSFAIWGLFTPSALGGLNQPTRKAVETLIEEAGVRFLAGAYRDFQILTPVDIATNTNAPQEFLVRGANLPPMTQQVPEGDGVMLLALNLSFVFTMVWFLRGRR